MKKCNNDACVLRHLSFAEKSKRESSTCATGTPYTPNKSSYMRMSCDCPAAATACFSARFLGRCASFSFRQPNPTAADVTIMTPKPAEWLEV